MSEGASARPGRISRYRILHRLGSGGMGDVYAAMDETLQRRVALKAIQAGRRLNLESQERFLREARILSQLDHPNICRAYDYVQDTESDWLVMELVDGFNLGDTMRRHALSESRALAIAEQIASVLVVTHEAGIVHRDLKPGNVMITLAGDVKVLDFGLARSGPTASAESEPVTLPDVREPDPEDEDATRAAEDRSGGDREETHFQTRHDSTVGTVPYMSPEQARGEPVSSASDMFSLGLVMQEMLTGQRAYPSGLPFETLIERVRNGEVDQIAGTGDLVQLARRLTSTAPSQRPTAVEALARLRWIRDAPKRRLRRIAAAAAVAVVVLSVVKYTVDLRRERTVAVEAEADANRRRGQAEDLIGFMLDDLRSKLVQAGRLDLLEDVGSQAMEYFASVPPETLTGEELSRRAQAIYQIGAVRQQQGNLAEARAAYDESLALARQVVARDPDNSDWQLRLAAAHFYAGDIRRRENDLAGAMREFSAYRDVAVEQAARHPDDLTWALEVSYGHGGVAAVQELQGDLEGARQGLELALAAKQGLVDRDPENPARQKDLATAHNRLGVVLDKQGDPAGALAHYQADLAIRRALEAKDPRDLSIKRQFVVALDAVAKAHLAAGDLTAAATFFQEAYDIITGLAAGDPGNANWQRDLATFERRTAGVLRANGRTTEALTRYQRARSLIGPIAAAAPSDVVRQRDLGAADLDVGTAYYVVGNVPAARAAAASSEAVLRAVFKERPDSETAGLLAESILLAADCAERTGEAREARRLRESALDVVHGVTGWTGRAVRAAEARALFGLGRRTDAQPLVTELVAGGYRHPDWIATLRHYGVETGEGR